MDGVRIRNVPNYSNLFVCGRRREKVGGPIHLPEPDISSVRLLFISNKARILNKMFYFTNICFCSGKHLLTEYLKAWNLHCSAYVWLEWRGEGEGCISKDWDGVCCSYTGKNGAGGGRFLVQYVCFCRKKNNGWLSFV